MPAPGTPQKLERTVRSHQTAVHPAPALNHTTAPPPRRLSTYSKPRASQVKCQPGTMNEYIHVRLPTDLFMVALYLLSVHDVYTRS